GTGRTGTGSPARHSRSPGLVLPGRVRALRRSSSVSFPCSCEKTATGVPGGPPGASSFLDALRARPLLRDGGSSPDLGYRLPVFGDRDRLAGDTGLRDEAAE